MSGEPWRVLVLRVWREGGVLRVRVLLEGDGPESFVVAGVPDAVLLLQRLLADFEGGETDPATDR